MKTNNSIDFKGTDKIFLEIRRENLKLESIECAACGKQNLKFYWKFGICTVEKRAHNVCDECHTALTK